VSEPGTNPDGQTSTEIAYVLLESKLRELIPSSPARIHQSDRMESLIPSKHRRRIWHELRQAGFDLPSLELSFRIFLGAIVTIVTSLTILAYWIGEWSVLFALPICGILAWLIRPLAIHPPSGCETVYQAACYLTQFNRGDYKARPRSQEEVACKVREVLAEAACASPNEIRGDMTIKELFGP